MTLVSRFQSLFGSSRVNVNERFELLREAISGTMSKFYMARDRKLDRIVGLKIGDREKVTHFEARFKGLNKPPEGKIALELNGHPNVVVTLEHGRTTDNVPYVVMEYVHGHGLNMLLNNRDPVLEGKRINLIRQMAEALAHVHRKGYIHRDVCPRNFICDPEGKNLTLIDFGLTLPAEKPFMQPGNRTGTPLYMAPEVVRRRWTDQRLDIFSFGVSAYHVCTFELPWPVMETSGLAALAHDTAPPRPILDYEPDLNPKLAEIIMKCMDPDPNKRLQTMEDVLIQLRQVDKEAEF